jgi:hypothetical protein
MRVGDLRSILDSEELFDDAEIFVDITYTDNSGRIDKCPGFVVNITTEVEYDELREEDVMDLIIEVDGNEVDK